jgi:hypothetical protein
MSLELNESHNFTYINKLTNEFYKFVGEIYIEYNKKKVEAESESIVSVEMEVDQLTPDISEINMNDSNETNETNETNENKKTTKTITQQTFIEYLLFKLYYNYGIKRRMVNENIALLYYSKNLKGYKSNEPITMLCRHMLLDTRIMRIISLGIPKAVKLDNFCNVYNIDKDNAITNFDSCNPKYRVYKFSEGTMLIYNPTLKKYSITTITTKDDEDDEIMNDSDLNNEKMSFDKSTQDLLDNNIEIKFNQQFMYSTRKVVGTGCFNSVKTFFEMFEENNNIANTNLENIPEDFINDKVLVFNIEHPENRVISTQLRNFNTLCGVFQVKNENVVQSQYDNIMQINYSIDNEDSIRNAFKELGNDMVIQIQVATFKKQLQQYNVNLHLPEIIKSFETLEADGITKKIIKIEDLSITQIDEIVQKKPKDFQGYIMYGINGERTKFTNLKYKALRSLKGSKPIVIEKWNTKNLFNLYWRLVKEEKIHEFIKEFDLNTGIGELGNHQYMYTKLFNWFLSLVQIYSVNLFKIYHNSFVKKTFQKSQIPFSMKPMCGDLHTEYLKNKVPISPTMVEQYIFKQPVNKIFWRIFMDYKK